MTCPFKGTSGPGGKEILCEKQGDWVFIEKCNKDCVHYTENKGGHEILNKGRLDRTTYFMEIAKLISKRSPCKSRQVGCIIVDKYFHIKATGYNGPPQGFPHCEECKRPKQTGNNLFECLAVHAEMNALIQCGYNHKINAIYITDFPCEACAKMICNTTLSELYYQREYGNNEIALKVLTQKGIRIFKWEEEL